MNRISSSRLVLACSIWIFHPLLLAISWNIHGIQNPVATALSFLDEDSFSEYFENDDFEDDWRPPYKLIQRERHDYGIDTSNNDDNKEEENNSLEYDIEEVEDAPNIIPANIEKRRIETIQKVDSLIDCHGEAIDNLFIENIHKVHTAPVSPMVFALLTEDYMTEKRGEGPPPWSWDALASVCQDWLKDKELMHRTIQVKCFPLVPDSIMLSSIYPWDSENMWEYLKNKKEIEELHMDEVTMEPVTFDRDGLFANIQPWSFDDIPPKPSNATRTREELDWWAKMKQMAERRRDTFDFLDFNVRWN
jgi:hypothetical protein